MTDNTHSPQRSSRVVSVRLDTETIARLARLTERSRGFYLKAAIQAMLPILEENYWVQQATDYEESVIDREFRTIMDHALHPDDLGSDSI
ncbi:hypothetical protein CATRI_06385 [Corynebacterium atrinae]|uniref:hypothetical protein n=1 Tax=Corynebacterium atrinae TaxID=1336740 RepID=UPI0025B370A1|nr:hypothetical protein [Corynebacterium atrinae]WJY63359.1 hypothetical protein CATRI_06385 [Corynebacterium atrinae]